MKESIENEIESESESRKGLNWKCYSIIRQQVAL